MPKDVVADVEPLDVTGTRSVLLGTALWAAALVLLLPFIGRLRDDGNGDWIWTCVAGVALGVFGLWYCRRRAAALPGTPPDDVSG